MSVPPLVVRCGAFGDVVLVTSLIRLLAARYDSRIDVVGSGAWTEPLLQHDSALGHLQLISSRNTPYLLCPSQWALVRWLRHRCRGPVYLCDVNPNMRALLRRGGVPDEDIVERQRSDDSLNGVLQLWPDRWMALGQRDPLCAYPARHDLNSQDYRMPRLVVAEQARAELAQWRAEHGLSGPLVLFQPGNKRTHKRGTLATRQHPKYWPPERWAAVARAVQQQLPDAHILLCGSPAEHPVLEEIRRASHSSQVRNLAHELPIPRLLALLEQAHSMISVDTGPAHAAAALQCPLVVMFGGASPQQWRPLGSAAITVLGGELGRDSRVQDISVDGVIAAWRSLPNVRLD